MSRMTPEEHYKIVALYNAGVTEAEISERLGRDRGAVHRHVDRAIKEGDITVRHAKGKKKQPPKEKKPKKPKVHSWNRMTINMKQELPEKPDGITVRCTRSISRTCVYGSWPGSDTDNLCNYILCEGHSRGCDPNRCDKYSKITKDNPKRRSIR